MRVLLVALLAVGCMAPPATEQTPEPTDDEVAEFMEVTCDTFETQTLEAMVEVVQDIEGVSVFGALVLTGGAITFGCPDEIDQFVFELNYFYPNLAEDVVELIVESAG